MKVDISRDTFRPQRHFSSVRLEQGRVSVDADWNEQIEINHHYHRTTARDVIGASGTPKLESGFELVLAPDGSDVLIKPGRYYVDGILCELDTATASVTSYGPGAKQATIASWRSRAFAKDQWVRAFVPGKPPIYTKVTAVDATKGIVTFADEINALGAGAQLTVMGTYGTQPDLAVTLPSPLFPVGSAVLYLDVWEREVTALDDPDIREVALGGADTATRTRVVWQLKSLQLDGAGPFECSSVLPDYDALIAPPTGQLAARAKRDVTTDNPCLVPTSAGYRRLENQLYRVEIHDPGSLADGKATFKWSRENGAVVGTITGVVGKVLTLAAPPRDENLGFAAGDWVEITDDVSELAGTPGTLLKVTKAEGKQLTLNAAPPAIDLARSPKVRRWESAGALKVASDLTKDDGYLRLEDGVQIRFFDGTYRTGDFWLIPARTITFDVEWPSDAIGPLPQPRKGPRHHYARLAVITTALQDDENVSSLADCRRKFPPLTDITADDVSLDSDCDLLVDAKTVHEALDRLCHERDLRFHNKHLHGWGIVCGLQVYCGPDSEPPEGSEVFTTVHDTVTVKNGYAIDSNGNDIIVDTRDEQGTETGDQLQILEMLRKQKLLVNDNGSLKDGSVSLWMKQGATAKDRYRLELYDPNSNSWASILKNGFWWDVWTDCIVPLINAFKDEFVGPDPQTWDHIISFINVLAPLLFPQHGGNVYISPKEDAILRAFYEKLRKLLQSKTYCAMFDGRGFPDYDPIFEPTTLDPRPSTIFGRVLQGFSIPSRMRITPNGQLAFTLSGKIVAKDQSSIIHVFDIRFKDGEKLLVETAFPTTGATVTDVAFSPDSKTLYAIAILNGNDSLFATADISDPKTVKWGTVTTLCDFPLVTVQRSLTDPKKLYAVARGTGLFEIDVGGLQPNQPLLVPFTACGHLELAMVGTGDLRKQYAFCTVGSTPTYDRVRRIDLANAAGPVVEYVLPASNAQGTDDICVATEPNGKFFKLFAVANAGSGQTSKRLVRWDVGGAQATPMEATIDLQFQPPNNNPSAVDHTLYRLTYNPTTQRVLIASFESFLIKMVEPTKNELDRVTHPTQLWPIAIAHNPASEFAATNGPKLTGGVFVLNALSGTINNIPAAYVGKTPQVVKLAELAKYHKLVLEAFIDLFGKFAQYLKDCFCDHFLIHCPEGDIQKIYLARIDIKNEQVDNICNFSRRRYVHSFPTVEYWLTLVPVLPVVRKLVGDWCCTLIQQHFSKINAPDPATKADKVSSSSAYNGITFVQTLNPTKVVSTQAGSKLNLASALSKAFLTKTVSQPSAPAPAPKAEAKLSDVTYQPAGNATKYLAERNVTVLSKEVATGSSVTETLRAPATLKPNDNVVLVTDANDVVLGYRVVKPATTATVAGAASTEALVAELGKRDSAISDLRAQLDVMKASNDSIRTQLDAMRTTNEAVRGQLEALATSHKAELAARDKQLAEINTRMTTLMTRLPPR